MKENRGTGSLAPEKTLTCKPKNEEKCPGGILIRILSVYLVIQQFMENIGYFLLPFSGIDLKSLRIHLFLTGDMLLPFHPFLVIQMSKLILK